MLSHEVFAGTIRAKHFKYTMDDKNILSFLIQINYRKRKIINQVNRLI